MALIFHLSDFHISSVTNLGIKFLPNIAEIVSTPDYSDIRRVLVLISGDIAFSGKSEQYGAFRDSLYKLKARLEERTSADLKFFVVAGNHDCDFDLDDTVRQLIIKSIPTESQPISDSKLIEQCVKVQHDFQVFKSDSIFEQPLDSGHHIFETHLINDGDIPIRLNLYNTAWVSKLHEEPGKMSYPRLYLEDEVTFEGITLSVLHHPTNWLTPNRRRIVDRHLDTTSDMVFFGHEHLPEEFTKSDFSGSTVGYFLGGVFQEKAHDCPGHFNVVLLDESQGRYKFSGYERAGENFQKRAELTDWISLGKSKQAKGMTLTLSQRFHDWITDLEIDFAHTSGNLLTLEDILILPDFEIVENYSEGRKRSNTFLDSSKFQEFSSENDRLLIFGSERSGKTTLAKWLANQYLRKGLSVIYLDLTNKGKGYISGLNKEIRKAFAECYTDVNFEYFEHQHLKQRAVIVDNLHQSNLNVKGRLMLVSELGKIFGKSVIFGDQMMLVEQIANGVLTEKEISDYRKLSIKPFGRYLRRRLIRRWYFTGRDFSTPTEELERSIKSAENMIDTLLGRSFLPSVPVFILGFLQTLGSVSKVREVGICGYHYQTFVTNSLERGDNKVPLDLKFRFLSEFSSLLNERGIRGVSPDEFDSFFTHFKKRSKSMLRQKDLEEELLRSKLIEFYDDEYRFKYSYAYYFFIAQFLHNNIEKEEIKLRIIEMSKNFHQEKNSNIWLFLVHLSKSPFLLEIISNQAKSIFSEATPLKLESDIPFLRGLDAELRQRALSVPSEVNDEILKTHYDATDISEAEQKFASSDTAEDEESRQIIATLDSMIRTITVLGQLLKNFPGSLDGDDKVRIARDSYELGLRGLSKVVSWMEEGKDEWIKFLEKRISSRTGTKLTPDELRSSIRVSLASLVEMNIFGVIKLVSLSLGAEGQEVVFDEVNDEINSNASNLIGLSISLDTLKLPKERILELEQEFSGDVICSNILRSLVAQHFYLFPENRGIRDEICAKLDINVMKPGKGLPVSARQAHLS
ncbi:MAG: metallophosphoesterase [Verrucomicrobiota bacterium JB023]|nr:metallophosphoesterase [Verrucomicrobiota bacterium JB023]